MVTLANLQGQSLVPDLTPALNLLGETFGTRSEREAGREVEQLTEQAATGSPEEQQQALIRLSSIAPQVAQSINQAIQTGDTRQLQQANQVATEGLRTATLVKQQPDLVSKRRMLRQIIQQKIANGQDPSRAIALANLPGDQLDNRIQMMEVAGFDAELLTKNALAPPQPGFTLSPGQQRFGPGGEPIAGVPKEPEAPQTAIAKARQDLSNNLITQADFKKIQSTPTKFQSTVGKLVGDRKAVVDAFGEGSEQVKALDEAIESESKGKAPKLSDVGGIRKEFSKLSADFIITRDAIGKVMQAANNPSAAGDLSLIFNFMKILDPNSVVRESEFATAQNAASLPGQLGAAAQRVVNGERMLDTQRNDFVDTANRLFGSQKASQIRLEESFREIATRNNIKNPDDVVVDFIGDFRDAGAVAPPPEEPDSTFTGQKTPEGLNIFQRSDGSTFAVSL